MDWNDLMADDTQNNHGELYEDPSDRERQLWRGLVCQTQEGQEIGKQFDMSWHLLAG